MTQTTPITCPSCGATTQGNFCGSCGAPLGPRPCPGCGTALPLGARFCQGCGTAVSGTGTQVPPAARPGSGALTNNPTPWIVAGILCVVAIGSIVYSARSRNEPAGPNMANAGNATGVAANADSIAVVRAPDISNMTPRERFTRLADRIQTAIEARDSSQVFRFFPMAEGAFTQLPAADRDIDARYHMGMLWAQVGEFAKAKAQTDSLMAAAPGNLFGYYLYAMLAEFQGDSATARKSRTDFRDHYASELKQGRPEYKEHAPFLDQYRKGAGAN